MAIVPHFYNSLTRKYIAIFGTLFNEISITREDDSNTEIQKIIVPIAYGPHQKFLAKINSDPSLDRPFSVSLPRISFEINSMNYDSKRKLGTTQKYYVNATDPDMRNAIYTPAPYDINFSLVIMTKYAEDGVKILEQILPFFQPDLTTNVKLIEGMDPIDIPVVLTGVTSEDVYDGDFETRRALKWTLEFTMNAYYFGPIYNKRVIKNIDLKTFNGVDSDTHIDNITIKPGMTANNVATTDPDLTVPYSQIELDDDWGIITIIEENNV